jgi:UDP-glucose 4-epimerase
MTDLTDAHILVIGGAGFIGSHVVDQLLGEPVAAVTVLDSFVRGTRGNLAAAAADPRVTVVEGSVLDRPLLAELVGRADLVVHLAALWLHECVDHPRRAVEHNVLGTYNVVEAAQAAGVRRAT